MTKIININVKEFEKKYQDLSIPVIEVQKFFKMNPETFYNFIHRNNLKLRGRKNNGRPYKFRKE